MGSFFSGSLAVARGALSGLTAHLDVIIQESARWRRKLLAADVESTMIAVERIDELADYAVAESRQLARLFFIECDTLSSERSCIDVYKTGVRASGGVAGRT